MKFIFRNLTLFVLLILSLHGSDISELLKKAHSGNPEAQFQLAKAFDAGRGLQADALKAAEWYYRSAIQGHADAAEFLATLYEEGSGVERDTFTAAEWKGIAKRNRSDQKLKSSEYPLIDEWQDAPEIQVPTSKVKEDVGNIALIDAKIAELEKLKTELLKRNDTENEEVQKPISFVDPSKNQIEKRSKDPPKKNQKISVPVKSIKLRSPKENFEVGVRYFYGVGLKQNYEQAHKYLKLSAEKGYKKALHHLGSNYFMGYGVAQDYQISYALFSLARSSSDDSSSQALNILNSRMSFFEITKAKKIAESFRRRISNNEGLGDLESEKEINIKNDLANRLLENRVTVTFEIFRKPTGGIRFFSSNDSKKVYSDTTFLLRDGSFAFLILLPEENLFPSIFGNKNILFKEIWGEVKSSKLLNPIELKEIAFVYDPRLIIVPLYINPDEINTIEFFQLASSPDLLGQANIFSYTKGLFLKGAFTSSSYANYIKFLRQRSFYSSVTPTKGNYAFSLDGELVGVMMNKNYAYHVKDLGQNIYSDSRTKIGSSFDEDKFHELLENLRLKYEQIDDDYK
jgi:TPR repeat protein